MYEDKKHPVAAFKATVRYAFQQEYTGAPLQGPLDCSITFVLPRPQSMVWKTRDMPRARHAKKPDRDNLDKAVMDALKGIAWIDDAQVCDGRIQKWIAAGDEQPHAVITIRQLEGVA
jgi:Holliday junction resolvase RusA-like endonuclease